MESDGLAPPENTIQTEFGGDSEEAAESEANFVILGTPFP
jgi:hypothetical protein